MLRLLSLFFANLQSVAVALKALPVSVEILIFFTGLVFLHQYLLVNLLFVYCFPYQIHLGKRHNVGKEVIIAQGGGKIIENTKKHYWHDIHHGFHAGHLSG